MNGPSMLEALLGLRQRDHDGAWSEVPGLWWVDLNGIAHGRVDHGGPSAVETTGTLGELLGMSLCQRRSCVSIQKNFGDEGVKVASAAQAFTEVVRVVDDAVAVGRHSPYRLLVEYRRHSERLEMIKSRSATRVSVVEGMSKAMEGLQSELDAAVEDARRAVRSEGNRGKLRAEAVESLLWGPGGPAAQMQQRMIGAADETGDGVYLDLGVISNREELVKLASNVETLHPTLISQLVGIDLIDPIESTRTLTCSALGVGDKAAGPLTEIATQRWRTVAARELLVTLDAIDVMSQHWTLSNGFCALDVHSARQSPNLAKVAGLLGRRSTNAQFLPFDLAQARVLLSDNGTAYRFIDEALMAFGDPLPVQEGRPRRVVVVPAVIAAALTQTTEGAAVEIGQLPLSSATIAKIETADALLNDGGVYENLELAWEAATRICA
jgi:hypothetical protein